MHYRLMDGPMIGMSIPAATVGDPPVDLFYEPRRAERLPDGRTRSGCLLHGPQDKLPPGKRELPRYVFDEAQRAYVWRGPAPKRHVHRGVAIERYP